MAKYITEEFESSGVRIDTSEFGNPVDAKTGEEVWRLEVGGILAASRPLIHNDTIYIGCWDCNLYAISIKGELFWKFPTSLSYQSVIDIEPMGPVKTAEVTWTPVIKKEKKKYKEGERDIADYGSFSGKYIDVSKSDYLGRKKKGYV